MKFRYAYNWIKEIEITSTQEVLDEIVRLEKNWKKETENGLCLMGFSIEKSNMPDLLVGLDNIPIAKWFEIFISFFFHLTTLKILAIAKAMTVFFALLDKKTKLLKFPKPLGDG